MTSIVFISELQDPLENGSSTQVLSELLIQGLSKCTSSLTVVGIIDPCEDKQNIIDYYSSSRYKLVLIDSDLYLRSCKSKFHRLFKLYYFYFKKFFVKNTYGLESHCNYDSVILSHCPSIEVSIISTLLSKFTVKPDLQLWSDPISWSGVDPFKLPIFRYILLPLEYLLYKNTSKKIFFSESLYFFQHKLFSKCDSISGFVDLPANLKLTNFPTKCHTDNIVISYVGNARPSVRNISHFVEASNELSNFNFKIICNEYFANTEKHIDFSNERISSSSASQYERDSDILVVLLNHTTPQIPGKVYYYIGANKPVVVILDGKYSALIKSHLSKFNQIIFCSNTKESIKQAIIDASIIDDRSFIVTNSPESICRDILNEKY
jgi:hypothetical protein